jgi:tetratricopeptide (TPR) repeat protein
VSFMFWGLAIAMLIAAMAFIAVPLKTGKSLLASPKALVVALVPLCAVGLYAIIGSPDEAAIQHVTSDAAARPGADKPLGSVASMVEGLAARLEQNPDDADGWILLARSYQHLGQSAEALNAYQHARDLDKTDVKLETSLLGGSLSGQVSSEQVVTQTSGPTLRGRVALSPAAAALVQPDDTLFIFAKESREHRMPVVALRKTVSELPFEFALTDKEVMVPGSKLSDYEQLVITAKISRSGNATDNSLGLEAWSEHVSPNDETLIDLLIGSANE